jgi:hypothetical protein
MLACPRCRLKMELTENENSKTPLWRPPSDLRGGNGARLQGGHSREGSERLKP